MKEIFLRSQKYQGKVALVDDEDFEYLNQWKWCVQKDGHTYYAVRTKDNKSMHRLIMNIDETKILIDHRDRDGLNNQKYNLRRATRSQNGANRCPGKNKYIGVCWNKETNKWKASIRKDNKDKHIGYFKILEDAAVAYNKAAIQIHGEFANLNSVPTT